MILSRRAFAGASVSLASAAANSTHWDVAVYGGTPCGIAASIMASRQGARVFLIEPSQHVGGLSTSGINTAETEHMLLWTIGGFALEFYRRLGDYYGTGKPEFFFESSVAERVYLAMLREAGVTVRYGERVETVDVRDGRIRSVKLTGGATVEAKVFVDAGYVGDLMARSNVTWAAGRESRAKFGEEAAGVRFEPAPTRAATVDARGKLLPGISGWAKDLQPGNAHPAPMNYNFRLTFARDPALQRPIPKPSRYDPSRYTLLGNWLEAAASAGDTVRLNRILDFYARRNGKFEVNNRQSAIISLGHFGGQFGYPAANYKERDAIVAEHWEYTLGLLQYLAEDARVPEALRAEMRGWGLHRGEFADNGNLPYQLYVREARRMRGAYVMAQRDIIAERRKDDAIGISSHFIDCHHVQRLAVSPHEFVNEGRIWRTGQAYQIPYRALTPKRGECTNLLVPGAASFSHVAFCTYRLESVWMIGGHAAGVAAALAARGNHAVQDVNIKTLGSALRSQKQIVDFIPGAPEKWTDINRGTGGFPEV